MKIHSGSNIMEELVREEAPIWPATFAVTLAVNQHGEPVVLAYPSFIADWMDAALDARDCSFTGFPPDPGVYRCRVDWKYGADGDPDFPITDWQRLCGLEEETDA